MDLMDIIMEVAGASAGDDKEPLTADWDLIMEIASASMGEETNVKKKPSKPPPENFLNEDGSIYVEDLFEEFERTYITPRILSEARSSSGGSTTGEKVTFNLPKFVPNDAWGDPTSDAFKMIEPFVFRVMGGGEDIGTSLDKLFSLFNMEESKVVSPTRIISSLILIESLASIFNSYNDSSAGFAFEGFLAAITFGEQVSERAGGGGSLPIDDIIMFSQKGPDGRPASLKLLKGRVAGKRIKGSGPEAPNKTIAGTDIHGSYKNLVAFFMKNEEIDYIVASKLGERQDTLHIHTYTITRSNLVDFLLAGSNHNLLRGCQEKDGDARTYEHIIANKNNWKKISDALWRTTDNCKGGDWDVANLGTSKAAAEDELAMSNPHAPRDAISQDVRYRESRDVYNRINEAIQNSMKNEFLPGPRDMSLWSAIAEEKDTDPPGIKAQKAGGAQWGISQANFWKLPGMKPLTSPLDLSTDKLEKLHEYWGTRLTDDIKLIFNGMEDLSKNITLFFAHAERKAGKSHGTAAVANTRDIKEKLEATASKEADSGDDFKMQHGRGTGGSD